MKPAISKQVVREDAFYAIHWSKLTKVDRYEITTKVPSVAGIFELYYMDEKKKLNLMLFGVVWYGGLRSRLRRLSDPEITGDPKRVEILQKYECYYRYSMSESLEDMRDIIYFFASRLKPGSEGAEHSGRYETIYCDESSSDKIVTI
jgi:hypothetical protein